MTMAFSSTNISYCSFSRIKLVPAAEQYFEKDSLFQKYISRPRAATHLSC